MPRLLIQVLWGRRELSSSKISTTSPHTLNIMKRRFCPAEIVSSQTWRGSIFTMTDIFGILAFGVTGQPQKYSRSREVLDKYRQKKQLSTGG
jgi:hypothetical protein